MAVSKRVAGVIGVAAMLALSAGPATAEQATAKAEVAPVSKAIATTENAKTVADAWLKFGRTQGVKAGEVHDLGLIYVVDLVKDDGSGAVVNQLIIRVHDGFTQSVY